MYCSNQLEDNWISRCISYFVFTLLIDDDSFARTETQQYTLEKTSLVRNISIFHYLLKNKAPEYYSFFFFTMQSHPVEFREKIIHRSSSRTFRCAAIFIFFSLNDRTECAQKSVSFYSSFHELRSPSQSLETSLGTDSSLLNYIRFDHINIRDWRRWYNRFNRIIKGDQRPMMVGSSAIAISSVGALSLFRFLENSMKAHPERRLHRNTIHARINEKLYLRIAPFGNVVCMCLLSNSIEERSTCITTMLQAAATRLNVHPSKLSPPENWRGDCALSDIRTKRKIRSKILSSWRNYF